MCQIVFQAVATSPRGYQAGDPVDVLEDGAELGREVDPDTNPASVFRVVDLPGVPAARVKLYLQEQDRGPAVQAQHYIDRKNASGYFDEVEEAGRAPLLRKRAHQLMLNRLAQGHRDNWNSRRRMVLGEAEFEAAVFDKRTGQKIDRGTVRRG